MDDGSDAGVVQITSGSVDPDDNWRTVGINRAPLFLFRREIGSFQKVVASDVRNQSCALSLSLSKLLLCKVLTDDAENEEFLTRLSS